MEVKKISITDNGWNYSRKIGMKEYIQGTHRKITSIDVYTDPVKEAIVIIEYEGNVREQFNLYNALKYDIIPLE